MEPGLHQRSGMVARPSCQKVQLSDPTPPTQVDEGSSPAISGRVAMAATRGGRIDFSHPSAR